MVVSTSVAGWEGILADGYIPSRRKLVLLGEQIYGADFVDSLGEHLRSNDDLFLSVLDRLEGFDAGGTTAGEEQHTGQHCARPREIYYLDVQMQPGHRLLLDFMPLYEEQLYDDRRKDNKKLVLLHKPAGDSGGEQYMYELLCRLDFRIKGAKRYRNLEGFQAACEELLDMMLEPYITPHSVVQEVLASSGLRSHVNGFYSDNW